ncbi:MAG: LacI family DNA-binding transcriptional regulator [Streptosporangiaceae bacterium]|jgi:DNA-binding LacI/PurR family transcriptional regulator
MDVTGHTSGSAPDPAVPGTVAAERGSRSVSIRDVAAAAGVSYQTVSRVINSHPSVRESTRELILATIDDLGFRPNRAARALAGGPVQSVTVLTPNTTLYGHRSALQGIEEAARAAGFAVGVRIVESTAPAEVSDAVAWAVEPSGALIVIAYDEAGTAALAAVPPEVPMVAMVETPAGDEGQGKPWVWLDDRRAALEATRYLLGLGHRTVHYLAIPSSTHTSQRQAGWRTALEEAGAPVPEPAQCGWTPQSGYQAGHALGLDPDVTAVLCGNDDLALGLMRAMHEAGRAIPAEVSVVGFDDTPAAGYLTPSLTTVRMDFAELGRASFALLQALLEPETAVPPVPWPQPVLIIRESAGPPNLPRGSWGPARQELDARHSKGASRD